MPAKEYKMQ